MTTEAVSEQGENADQMGKQIWVSVTADKVTDLQIRGGDRIIADKFPFSPQPELSGWSCNDDDNGFTLCAFRSNVQPVAQQHSIGHLQVVHKLCFKDNHPSQGSPSGANEAGIQKVESYENVGQASLAGDGVVFVKTENEPLPGACGSWIQKGDSLENVGQTSCARDSVVFVKAEKISPDENTQVGPEVLITCADAVIKNEVEVLADCDEANSKDILCEICSVKVPKPFITIHANGHLDAFTGERCPICHLMYTWRTTLSRHLASQHKLNIDGNQLTDKVDDHHRSTTAKMQTKGTYDKSRVPYAYRTKRIVDRQKIISAEEIKWQLEDTQDILRSKDFAPATKYLMYCKKMSGIGKLFAYPSRPMFSKKLIQRYMDSLRTVPVGNEDIKTC